MKTQLNSLNRTANTTKISGEGNSHILKCLLTILLLLTLGVGEMWADVWIRGDMNNWENSDDWKFNDGKLEVSLEANTDYTFKVWDEVSYGNDHYRSYDLNGGKITGTIVKYNLDKDNVADYNLVLHTDEAGTYIFQYAYEDSKYKLSIYFPKARLQKQKYVYFDARRLTGSNSDYWQRGDFTARFWFKYYDSGSDNGSVDCNKDNALENWVYYALVPDHDYIGQIQLNRLQVETEEALCVANIAHAKDRPSSLENCLQEESGKEDYCNAWTPQWTTYCPPMSSVSLSDNGTTNWGGDGSSADPYLVPTDASIEVQASEAVSVLDDDNMTVYYRFKKEGTEVQAGSATATATITASSTTGTKEAVTVEAYNYYNSTSGTSAASSAIYYETRTPYTISYNKGTPSASISGSRESEIKLKDVAFTLPGAVFTRTGYTQTGWATSDGGAKAYELSASYTANEAVTLYPFWTPKNYTVTLEGMEADSEDPISVKVTYDAVLPSLETKHTKAHYDLLGYWAANDDHGMDKTKQLIDGNGNWIPDVADYTGNDGEGHPTWIRDGIDISLFADWTEHSYTVTTSVSPAGAGNVQVSGETVTEVTAGYAMHSPEMTAVPANAAWVFKEWQVTSNAHLDLEHYSTTGTTMKITATDDDQTLTAVFERRYGLIGSLNEEGDPDGGMPNKNGETWGVERSADYEADFEVIGFTALGAGDGTGVDLQCTRYLLANKQYKFQVVDRSTIGRDRFCLEENGSAVLEPGNSVTLTYKEKVNANVLLNTEGEGYYTFKITNISNDGNYYPTLTVIRPQQVNFGQKYQDIDGTLHTGTTGGTAAATAGSALSSGVYVTYNTSVIHTATATSPGYTFAGWWSSDAFEGDAFSNTNPMTYAVTSGDNAYAKFVEKATAVTLSNDGHGHVEIDGMTVSSTTVGITTHRELTAVPDEGYKFNSWTIVSGNDIALSSTSTNPTTLSGLGSGAASGQEVRANFVERWALSAQSEGWGSAEFNIANVSIVDGKAIGYVDIVLPANTDMQFKMVDKLTDYNYMNGSDQVYYMTNGNSHNWSFATDKTYNCGITTAGAGTYRFIWNITDKKMTVTYPNFVIYRTGDKDGDKRATEDDVESYAGGTISQAIEFRMKVNELDYWYTLCLPFTVTAVKVWDEEDGQYYDIVPYYRKGDKYYTGHYIIRTPLSTTDFAIENFDSRDRWVDPPSADGYLPSANTPYIIQWHTDGDNYFLNKYISFFGATGQTIPTSMNQGANTSSDETVNIYGNNCMTSGTVRDAYMLDSDYGSGGAWLRAKVGTDRTVLPFECFIRANATTTAKYRVLRRDMADTPTGWDTVSETENKTTKVLIDNNIYIIRGGKMYTIQGTFVKEVE